MTTTKRTARTLSNVVTELSMKTTNSLDSMKPYKTVEIPHLRHTVKFMDMSALQGVEIQGSGYTAKESEDITLVFIQDIENTVKDYRLAPWIAHELVHVLQILCDKINANFVNEQEHMAYIMHYLFVELQDKK